MLVALHVNQKNYGMHIACDSGTPVRTRGPATDFELIAGTHSSVEFSKMCLKFKFEAAGSEIWIDPTITSNSNQHSKPHLNIAVAQFKTIFSRKPVIIS